MFFKHALILFGAFWLSACEPAETNANRQSENLAPVFEHLSDDIKFINPRNAAGKPKTFDELIGEFKGKVVYVDFWASWCGPCRQQFPYSKEIHQQLEGKDVVFLYISFDDDENAWRRAIEKFAMPGYHILPTDEQKQAFYNRFQVTGIPRYMLIDKNGKVVDDNAKRPSSKEALIKDIEKLLAKS